MTTLSTIDLDDHPTLARFRAALDALFRSRIERVVPFGSRARGNPRSDADYDVAIFLHGFVDRGREMDLLSPPVTHIVEETGVVIHPLLFRAGAWGDRTPPMHELRPEGVDL